MYNKKTSLVLEFSMAKYGTDVTEQASDVIALIGDNRKIHIPEKVSTCL